MGKLSKSLSNKKPGLEWIKNHSPAERWALFPPEIQYRFSRCHAVEYSLTNIYWIQTNGAEKWIGKAWMCAYSHWNGRRTEDCGRIYHIKKSSVRWPKSLSEERFREIAQEHGITYWLSSGYHLLQTDSWHSIREYNCLPPTEWDIANLLPAVKNFILFRGRFPEVGGVKELGGLVTPKGSPQRRLDL